MNKKKISFFILILEIILVFFIYSYPLLKNIPAGSDAVVYLNDANWMIDHQTVPEPQQKTYNSYFAYVSPINDLILVILNKLTGLDLVYPLFSLYQLYLVVLIIASSYLIGKIYDQKTAILIPISLVGSFSIISLFNSSTIANLLAFVYINLIYYLIYIFTKKNKFRIIFLISILILSVYFCHRYLSAPILILFFIIYILYLFFLSNKYKFIIFKKNRFKLLAIVIISIIICISILYLYLPVIKEGIRAFINPTVINNSMFIVPVSQYKILLGYFIFTIAFMGIIFYIIDFKNNILSYKAFPIIWLSILFIIMQLYKFNISFYYVRIVYMAGIFICLFASFFLSKIIQLKIINRYVSILIIILSFIIIISNSANRIKDLYDTSNFVSEDQIHNLKLLTDITKKDDIILSNESLISETHHDVIISNRNIQRIDINIYNCSIQDFICQAFNQPTENFSINYFRKKNIRYFLFLKPIKEDSKLLDKLIEQYSNSEFYNKMIDKPNIILFSLK